MKKLLLILASTFLLLSACSDEKIKEKKQWPHKIVYVKGDVWVNDKHATINSTLQESDTITTKSGSYAVISLSDFATISLKPNTRIYLSLLANGKSEIFQEGGKTFSKVKTGTNYSIKTPTVVAGVRGTSFEVSTTAYATSILLLDGKVEATSEVDTTVIDSGQKIVSARGNKFKKSEMSEKEIKAVRVVSAFTEEMKTNTDINEDQVTKTLRQIDSDDHPPVVTSPKKNMTLNEIKKKYGRIAQIVTHNGQTYTGYFNQSGEYMTIITTSGTVKIKVSLVSKVIPIQ